MGNVVHSVTINCPQPPASNNRRDGFGWRFPLERAIQVAPGAGADSWEALARVRGAGGVGAGSALNVVMT